MIRGLLFDINGTLTDILTDESSEGIYRTLSNFFIYQGIFLSAEEIRSRYFALNEQQRHDSKETFPEFDVVALFEEMIDGTTRKMSEKKKRTLAQTAAEIFRAASMFKLQLYPDVKNTLKKLKKKYRLAAVSDGQSAWAKAELNAVGLLDFFEELIVSGDYGYRKPDARLYKKALKKMNLTTDEAIFIGNDLYRDVYGANQLGMKTVFFKSNQGDHEYAATPDVTIEKFNELEEAIRSLTNTSTKTKAKKRNKTENS